MIYFVELHDYDRDELIGYFTDKKEAQICCEYLNIARPSEYSDIGCEWQIHTFNKCEYDYNTLLEAEKLRREIIAKEQQEQTEIEERALYERLKLKYGGTR